jgi:hypothetical protein
MNSVKDLSTELLDQTITSLVISTPKGGPHMVDSLDGSFRILGKKNIADETDKRKVLEAMSTLQKSGGIADELKGLNDFLVSQNITTRVTITQYIDYISTGDIKRL